jgi:uncharacterized membrane protein
MPSDNVTPFRRPPKRPVAPQQSGGLGFKTHRGKAVLAHLLTIAAYVLTILFPVAPLAYIALAAAVAAVLFVYSNRNEGMPWTNTHHEHALRTLVIGNVLITLATVLAMVVSSPLTPAGVTASLVTFAFWTRVVIVIWALLRAIIALVLATMRKPIPHPRGWFI